MTLRTLSLSVAIAASSTAFGEVSLQKDVVPILNQHCVMCHISGAALAGLDLYSNPWAALVGVRSTQSPMNLVEPHQPDKSYFYLKLTQRFLDAGGSGLQMPIQQDALSKEQLDVISSWIRQGAPNN